MGVKGTIRRIANKILEPLGVRLIREALLTEWQKAERIDFNYNNVKLPNGAEEYLSPNNERLVKLTELYSQQDTEVITPSRWNNKHLRPIDLKYFRGDNPYVWQFKDHNFESAYAITTYYLKNIDTLNLLEKLKEDGEFGVYTFMVDNKIVSRDLLDSINEIYFLEKYLGISKISNINLIDIGAGYGRLAYRMVEALPNIMNYFCTDAVPASTFISEYYLKFRNVTSKAKVVPLYEIKQVMENYSINIAVNIHSFSECTIAAIEWWLRILTRYKVKYLMIVPTNDRLLAWRSREDFFPILERNGYHLLTKEPKYRDPVVQKYGVSPTHYYLFEYISDG